MSSSRIAITGSRGVIGKVLLSGLKDYDIISLNLPDVDVKDYEQLQDRLKGVSTIVHLAKTRDKGEGDVSNADDLLMMRNIYKAAYEKKVKRVIMASSVHADNFYNWKLLEKLPTNRSPKPISAYGADKVSMEALGREYAVFGLEVICIRFGGVNVADKPPENNFWEDAVWLSHEDCTSSVIACLKAEKIPHNFVVFYAVSNNKNRIHDTNNPFNWQPE